MTYPLVVVGCAHAPLAAFRFVCYNALRSSIQQERAGLSDPAFREKTA
jgi:hypothetical protein